MLAIALPGIALIGSGATCTQTSKKSMTEICGDPSLSLGCMLHRLTLASHEFAEERTVGKRHVSCQRIAIELMLPSCAVSKCCRTSIDAVRRQIVVQW